MPIPPSEINPALVSAGGRPIRANPRTGKRHAYQPRPECPNPPAPRVLSSKLSTTWNAGRKTGTNTIKFKTKAIISHFSAAGAFTITYRNLVINVVANEPAASDEVSAFDEAAEEKGYAVKTGWGKEHSLECLLNDRYARGCTKNKTHAMVITSQQQVAEHK